MSNNTIEHVTEYVKALGQRPFVVNYTKWTEDSEGESSMHLVQITAGNAHFLIPPDPLSMKLTYLKDNDDTAPADDGWIENVPYIQDGNRAGFLDRAETVIPYKKLTVFSNYTFFGRSRVV